MIRIGCDVVYMPRLKDYLEDKRLLNKILTHSEQSIYETLTNERRRLEFLCGRYACKEAYAKATGMGIGRVDFLDFEVLRHESGQPISQKGQVTISHDGDYAVAMVMINV